MSDSDRNEDFYAGLDHAKSAGRGSACSTWSFALFLGTLFLLGVGLVLWLL